MRPGLARPRAGPPVAAHDPAAPARPGGRARAWSPSSGTELEFIAFDTSYEDAHDLGWRDLTPVNQYNVDYSILGTSRVEPLLRDIRNHMYAAGLDVEGAKGECNFGQHEIGFLYADAMVTADNHSVYKTAAKEIAAQRGQAITFMAKYDQREGNSCHIHLSLRGDDGGDVVFWDGDERTPLYDHFIAGVLATMRDFTLLYAPNVNSYKRFAAGSFAPTAVAWGLDNRTCAVRLVGHGPSARMENRLPGGDVNPYLALAAHAGRRPARHRATSSSSRTSWSATPTTPTSRTCRTRCARPASCSRAPRSHGRRSATRSSTTT